MDPVIGSALIGAGAKLIGGLFGSSAQKSANKTNLQIARETNAQNLRIYNDQKQYNTDMWNAQNAYNTPTAQRQRYEDAGINPYLALGNISSGSAQSSLTAPNAPNMVTPQVQPVTGMADALQSMTLDAASVYSQIANAEKIKAETEGQRIENGMKYEFLRTQINNMKKQGTGIDYDNDLKSLSYYIGDNTKDVSIQMANDQLHNLQTQGRLLQVQEDLANFDLGFKQKHAEEQFKAEMARIYTQNMTDMMNARTNQYNAQTNRMVGDKQIEVMAQDILESAARTTGIHLDNTQHKRSMEYLVGLAKSQLQESQGRYAGSLIENHYNLLRLGDYNSDWWNRTIQGYIHGGSDVIGMSSDAQKMNPKKPNPVGYHTSSKPKTKGFRIGFRK